MNKKNLEQTELSYYGLYLLNYLKENKFEQASDAAFVKARADEAAEAYERARLEGVHSRRCAGDCHVHARPRPALFPIRHPA